jgi:Family of unknown function (DUF6065)
MELEFYRVDPLYAPPVYQSSAKRDWMDASSTKHPYTCIPIVRANSHGWELRLPQDMTVTWDGGESPEGLQILSGQYESETRLPLAASLVGHGVLTFYTYYLIKTPEPYNLYVTGAPNQFIKGAAPLTGVVETYWSPYTFTMNWKIRYKNRPVTFKAGTPYVYFFPVNSVVLEEFTPVYKDVKEHENYEAYNIWSDGRIEHPNQVDGFYKKGIHPNGCPIANPELHKNKLVLKEPDENKKTS